jgi:hypothetical protein
MQMIPVKFRMKWGRYNAGEVAGFDEAKAHELVRSGAAEWYKLTREEKEQLARQKAEQAAAAEEQRERAEMASRKAPDVERPHAAPPGASAPAPVATAPVVEDVEDETPETTPETHERTEDGDEAPKPGLLARLRGGGKSSSDVRGSSGA